MKVYRRLTVNLAKTVRKEMLEGREHYVAPAAILAEGIWTANAGPIFYPNDENEKSASSWNHKPIVVNHPTDNEGREISACTPIVLNTRKIGILLNTLNDDKLRSEAWIDIEAARRVDKRIVESIEAGKAVEVSTGLEADLDESEGEYNGESYVGIARNYRPDHLAVLPDKLGAYSIASGGGLMVANRDFSEKQRKKMAKAGTALPDGSYSIGNEQDLKNAISAFGRAKNKTAAKRHIISRAKAMGMTSALPKDWKVNNEQLDCAIKSIPEGTLTVLERSVAVNAYGLGTNLLSNELTFSQIQCQLADLLSARFGQPGKYWGGYIIDVYPGPDGYVIFRDEYGDMGYDQPTQMWLMSYMNDGEEVSLSGEPQKVEREVVYKTDSGDYIGNEAITFTAKEITMAFDKKAHVTSLVKAGIVDEKDREKFEGLDETILQLHKIPAAPVVETTPLVNAAKKEETEQKKEVVAPTKRTFEELLNEADPATRNMLISMKRRSEAEIAGHIKTILANANNKFKEEYLKGRSLEELEGLAALAQTPEQLKNNARYDLNVGILNEQVLDNAADDEPILTLPDTFELAKKQTA